MNETQIVYLTFVLTIKLHICQSPGLFIDIILIALVI
jgi:hypothetical protein